MMSLRRETARDADRAGLGYARRMNRLLLLTFALAGLAVALSPAVARAQAHADTILVDGKVWTGTPQTEVRRVGKECVRPCGYRWAPCHQKIKMNKPVYN